MRQLPRALTVTAVLGLVLATIAPATAGQTEPTRPDRYTNPVTRNFADTFADPVVIRGQDGYWYAYGTSDPLREGEKSAHHIPTARSADLVNWTFVGDAFGADQRPPYATTGAMYWA